jgi:hypothetical protein
VGFAGWKILPIPRCEKAADGPRARRQETGRGAATNKIARQEGGVRRDAERVRGSGMMRR